MVLSRAIESVTNLLSSGFQASRQLNRTSQLNSTAAGTREEGPERQQSTSSAADQLRGVEEDSRPVAGPRAQIAMFYRLVKNIKYFHGRGVPYGPTQFANWRQKHYKRQMFGENFDFDGLGHFFWHFRQEHNLPSPEHHRYWIVEAEDWNFYLNQLNPEGSDGGSSESGEEPIEEEDPPAYDHLEGVIQPSDANEIPTQTAPTSRPVEEEEEVDLSEGNLFEEESSQPRTSGVAQAISRAPKDRPMQKGPALRGTFKNEPTQSQATRRYYGDQGQQPVREIQRTRVQEQRQETYTPGTTTQGRVQAHDSYQQSYELASSRSELDGIERLARAFTTKVDISINPLNDDHNGPAQWFKKYEFKTSINGWDAALMNQRLPSYLKGEALRHWHSMAARDRSSYDRVKAHILSKLDTVQRRWKAKTEYFSATQSAGESATEFARRLYRLYELAGGDTSRRNEELSEEFLIIRFEDGLETNLSGLAKSRNLSKWSEAEKFALRLDQIPNAGNQQLCSIQELPQQQVGGGRRDGIGQKGSAIKAPDRVDEASPAGAQYCRFCMVYTHNTDECSRRPTEGVPYQIPTQGSYGFSTQPACLPYSPLGLSTQPACLPYGPPHFYYYQGQPYGLPYPHDQSYGSSFQQQGPPNGLPYQQHDQSNGQSCNQQQNYSESRNNSQHYNQLQSNQNGSNSNQRNNNRRSNIRNPNQPAGNKGSVSFPSDQQPLSSKGDSNVKSNPPNNSA